jgi:hypothetical protein
MESIANLFGLFFIFEAIMPFIQRKILEYKRFNLLRRLEKNEVPGSFPLFIDRKP